MDISLYFDLGAGCPVENLISNLGDFFSVVDEPVKNTVVISDNENAGTKWNEFAVIGVEHRCRIYGVSYVTDSVDNIDEAFVRQVFCRRWGLPLVIKETNRLIIREVCARDVENICRLYEDVENVRYLPKIASYEEELELCSAYIKNMYGLYGYGLWGVFLKENDRLIGRAGLEHRRIGEETFVEIGYMIDRKFQGQGYGYEAAKAVVDFAGEYGVDELIAYINEKNTPSVKLAEKLGFSRQTTIKDGADDYILFRF